ncbi:ral guanine nucleotide dissociation stimulator-like [Eptesicus fuscus]|uniref:ral guanine nucleotide dissociation stimulator-like n=1 Tax=Eptesicus fuscus TaxID=29078 RepID=UPI002403AF63|nr:ral guanine nucleotide dissociation stimulator-like [Eptesicus fuscus]
MSLCCFPFFRGSGQKKAQAERCFCCCRNRRKRHHRSPLPSGRRHPQSSNKDIVEELADTFTYAINGYKGQVRQARKYDQCQTESSQEDIMEVLALEPDYTTYRVRVQVHQADDTVQCLSEGAAEVTGNLPESCRLQALHEGTLEQVATSMVPAFPGENLSHVSTLAFSRAQQFLEELLTRSCPPSLRADASKVFCTSGGTPPYKHRGDTPQDQVIKAIASIVGTWLDHVQDFGQPLPFPLVEAEQALLPINSPASRLVGHAQNLELEHLEPTEATREGPHPEIQSSPEPEEGPAQGPEPGPGRGPALAWPGLRQYLKPFWSQLLAVLEAFSGAVISVLGDYLK